MMIFRSHAATGMLGMAAMLAAFSIAACGSSADNGGPLGELLVSGRPVLGVGASIVRPGQSADGEAYVFNSAQGFVRITGISAVPVTSEPAGHLVNAGIQSTGTSASSDRGWPPEGVPVKPAIGAELPHGQSGIVFGVSGAVIGRNYVLAGLRVDYTYNGQSYSTTVWGGEAACVAVNDAADDASCQPFIQKANAVIEQMAGLS
jgi:hypothetical protein